MSRPTRHRPAPLRSAARALTLAGVAVGVWLLGQATASAEEPVQQPLPAAVEVGLAPVDQLLPPGTTPAEALAPVVSAARAPDLPAVVPAAVSSTVAEAAAPVTERLPPVHEVIAPVVSPVVGSVLAVTEQVTPVVQQVVQPAVEQALEPAGGQALQPVVAPVVAPVVPLPADSTATTPTLGAGADLAPVVPLPASVVPAAAEPSATAGTPLITGVDVPESTQTAPLPQPLLPRPASVPALPTSTSVQAGGSHPLDQQSADLTAAVLATATALGAAADDARDSAAAAPVEPSCSPD